MHNQQDSGWHEMGIPKGKAAIQRDVNELEE